jgi:hypothetical protein
MANEAWAFVMRMPAMQSLQSSDTGQIKFDESLWPIVVMQMPKATPTDAELDAFAVRVSSYYRRATLLGFVFDVRLQADLPAHQRRRIAELMDRDREQNPTVKCATAIVLSSNTQRGVFNVMTWLVRQPVPSRACVTVNEAVSWLREWLRSQVSDNP